MKVLRLESYEDALNNLQVKQHRVSAAVCSMPPKHKGLIGLKEQYMLRYMLDVETRGSPVAAEHQGLSRPDAVQADGKAAGLGREPGDQC